MNNHDRGLREFRDKIKRQKMADRIAEQAENEMLAILGNDYYRFYGVLKSY